ncbi:MAG: hypothetical protein ACRDS0_09585 [Pseudonocardiaceae bacterium]
MKSYNEIIRWIHIVVTTLVVWSQNHIEEVFKKLDIANYALLGAIVLAVAGMQLFDWAAIGVIDQCRWIRRILSGRNDIEGDWVEVVIDPANPDKITRVEYCRIRFQQGKYILSGDSWTTEGRWVDNFVTTGGATYTGRELEYYYKAGIPRAAYGLGVIIFSPEDSPPTEFVCRYLGDDSKVMNSAKGRRISTRLRRVDSDKRRDAALNFLASIDQKGASRSSST